jgi:hypothetical protein
MGIEEPPILESLGLLTNQVLVGLSDLVRQPPRQRIGYRPQVSGGLVVGLDKFADAAALSECADALSECAGFHPKCCLLAIRSRSLASEISDRDSEPGQSFRTCSPSFLHRAKIALSLFELFFKDLGVLCGFGADARKN